MKTKKLKKVKLGGSDKSQFKVTDPEDADRVLEVKGKKYVFTHGSEEKLVVSKVEAEALVEAYPYLVVEKL